MKEAQISDSQKENVKPAGGSKKLKVAIASVGALLLALLVFAGGVAVGLHKARFSYQWGQNYERNFMGSGIIPGRGMIDDRNGDDRPGGMMGGIIRNVEGRDFRNAHGLAGTVISISGNNLIVKDHDGKENTVAVDDQTVIKKNASDLKITDLQAGDQVVVMGAPNGQGVIDADLIRVFSPNPSNSNPTGNTPVPANPSDGVTNNDSN